MSVLPHKEPECPRAAAAPNLPNLPAGGGANTTPGDASRFYSLTNAIVINF